MELIKIRGGSEQDLKEKKYNIGVGISLGNKWFTTENIIELIKWSLQYSKESVIVYVADSIHSINLEIRNKYSQEKALEVASKMANDLFLKIKEEIPKKITIKEQARVYYANWNDLVDENYRKKTKFLYDYYATNDEFRTHIHQIVKSYTATESRKFSEEQINALGYYLIEELPELINRVPIRKMECDAFVYPNDGLASELVENIQKGRQFPLLKERIMDTLPKVFLQVR